VLYDLNAFISRLDAQGLRTYADALEPADSAVVRLRPGYDYLAALQTVHAHKQHLE